MKFSVTILSVCVDYVSVVALSTAAVVPMSSEACRKTCEMLWVITKILWIIHINSQNQP